MTTEYQGNIAFSQGLLEKWLELDKAPKQIIEALDILVKGISYYKEVAFNEKQMALQGNSKLSNSATQIFDMLSTVQHQVDQIAELNEELNTAQERVQQLEDKLGQQRTAFRRRTNSGIVEI